MTKKNLNHNLSQAGFSLIQVLVAFALTSILALQMVRMSSYQIKTSKSAEINLDITLLTNQIALYLSNSLSCTQTFQNVIPTQAHTFASGDGIMNKDGNVVFAVGEKYAGNKLLISEISIEPSASDPINPPNDLFGIMKVYITINKTGTGENTLGAQSLRKELIIQVLADAQSGVISRCYSLKDESVASMRILTCEQDLGGTWHAAQGKCLNPNLSANSAPAPGSICGTC